ncbi:ribose-5-phosphate isomerase [Aliiroseovarius halocynthiae]|uniref:Ribose-5-phosphate isomerase A n=1 Tax=Aliiroseovarius halocynthiae TaxID=985055 RepID=A0A545SV10_9RHOB|nr:ribose-5-phosphate isomerase RpiA [Aliiroseovarius halocynthiae]TQV68786.1 ribose-5-phosphate isomerase RpiA [Aliiroseovarius halocynthiae]SMR71212.1 ribose-5-phosphate isomerase [Aliiroseovarius halocynthiae]
MSAQLSPIDAAKSIAAKFAVQFVEDGMRVGLGTGSTSAWMIRYLGERIKDDGLDIVCVPSSQRTAELAEGAGIRLSRLDDVKWLDVTIDGADEYDGELTLIKGGGGALLQEKIIATASDRMIVIADHSKEVGHLGAAPLPIEVVPFGLQTTRAMVEAVLEGMDVLGWEAAVRRVDGSPFTTDAGNHILDLHLNRIGDPRRLALALNQVPGVVENGLFIDICDVVVAGHGDGRVEVTDLENGTISEALMDVEQASNIFANL